MRDRRVPTAPYSGCASRTWKAFVLPVTLGLTCTLGLFRCHDTLGYPGEKSTPAAAHLSGGVPTRFAHLSVEQGLSQSTVQTILQDHAGFLWFGTEEGLNRYDGYSFEIFKHDARNPQSLPDDIVSALYEDHQQRLWVGTEHGLCLFDRKTETFTRVPSILDRVTGIVEAPDGTVWVGAEAGGLFLLSPATGNWSSYHPDPKLSGSLVSSGVSALLRDHGGRLWVGTQSGEVELFEEGKARESFGLRGHNPGDPASLSHEEVSGLAEDGEGNLWVGTMGGGLNVLDRKTRTFRHYKHRATDPNSLPSDLVTCVFVDHSGGIWVGTDGAGMLQYDPTHDRFLSFIHDAVDPASLSQNVIRSIYEDAQSHLWVGTFLGGANIIRRSRNAFGYFTYSPADTSGLSDPSVASFLEDKDGNIWVGLERGWLNRLDSQTGRFVRYRFPSAVPGGSAILCLHQDHLGRIWVGTYEGGLGRFEPRNGTFQIYKHRAGDPKSLGDDEVWAITEDVDGSLWLGTNAGLDRFDPNQGIVTTHLLTPTSEALNYADVRALLLDQHGNLWVGTLNGLDFLPSGSKSFVHYRHDDGDPRSLSNGAVAALYQDHKGRLWVGTLGGGLNLFDSGKGGFTSYKDFPSDVIYGTQEDSSGRLWLSTNHGLVRFNPDSGSAESFDTANGLQSLQFHFGASLKTRSGHILFGSSDGFYDFDPEVIKPDTFAPPVILTSLRIFNQPAKLPTAISMADQITLSHNDKIVSFEFAALDYTFPRRNQYAYAMEGFSDKWMELGRKREVTFTNLDPGTYIFRVKASNSDGVWNEASTTALKVTVKPPFWGTWWFRGLSAVLFVFLLITAHGIRVRRLTTDINERRESELALRKSQQLLQDIMDNSTAVIHVKDTRGRYLMVNRHFEDLFHINRDSITGKTDFDLFPRERADAFRAFDERVLSTGTVLESEEIVPLDDGLHTYISLKSPLCDETGKAYAVCGISTDITERKQLEDQLRQAQKMEAVGRLAGGIAHDFNNLLTVITGYSELLEAMVGDDRALRDKVSAISKAGNQASTLTRQLLLFSRRQIVQPKILDLNDVLSETATLLRRLVREDIELIIKTEPALGLIQADPGQIDQVVMNLVINARDAMPDGGKLTMQTSNYTLDEEFAKHHPGTKPGSYVRLTVNDTGSGMDAETQSHIFEPFFTTKGQGTGTGLGLATVYGIVQQAGGSIVVESVIGRGTTFEVYFPTSEGAVRKEARLVLTSPALGSETILVVEDQEGVRTLVCDILREHGYAVLPARDGQEALLLSEKNHERIDLMVTDVVMPQMGGYELAKVLAPLRPEMKILYMSGYVEKTIDLNEMSGVPFIHKPFTPEALARKVREVLGASGSLSGGTIRKA